MEGLSRTWRSSTSINLHMPETNIVCLPDALRGWRKLPADRAFPGQYNTKLDSS